MTSVRSIGAQLARVPIQNSHSAVRITGQQRATLVPTSSVRAGTQVLLAAAPRSSFRRQVASQRPRPQDKYENGRSQLEAAALASCVGCRGAFSRSGNHLRQRRCAALHRAEIALRRLLHHLHHTHHALCDLLLLPTPSVLGLRPARAAPPKRRARARLIAKPCPRNAHQGEHFDDMRAHVRKMLTNMSNSSR